MDDPQKIPPEDIERPTSTVGSPVDRDDPLVGPKGEEEVVVILDLGGSEKYPDDTPFVEKVEPIDDSLENIESVEVFYQEDESGPWIPVTDGVRDESHYTKTELDFESVLHISVTDN